MSDLPEVLIYTDGACDPNPGPGGWAAVLRFGEHEKVLTGAEPRTTNSRMELQAVIAALTALKKPCRVQLYTDSKYVRKGTTEHISLWKARGWQTTEQKAVANQDLWLALDVAIRQHQIEWHWVKGHAGDPLNERVDQLAVSMIPRSALPLNDQSAAHVFTGVSCLGKTGPGGWAVIVRNKSEINEISDYEAITSANRLHLLAALRGLESVASDCTVHLYTPSDYVAHSAQIRMQDWAARNWRTKDDQPVKHRELWQAIVAASQTRQVQWHVLKDEVRPAESQRAEKLAREQIGSGE